MTARRFEDAYTPYALATLTGARVMVLAPHPDDETFGCGGAILKHVAAGDDVKVLVLTDGAASQADTDTSRHKLADQRKAEAIHAAHVLGVKDIDFWMHPDRELSCTEESVAKLVSAITEFAPTLLYATSPHEFHPDHRICADLAWAALARVPGPCKLVFYEVNRPFKTNTLIDISDVAGIKQKACEAYVSQLRNIPYDDISLALNRFRALTVSSNATHVEAFDVVEHDQVTGTSIDKWLLDQFLSERTNGDRAKAPLVSIVVRTLDRPELLAEAVLSIEAQTYRNIEIVVVDGSHDGSASAALPAGELSVGLIKPTGPGRAAAANAGLSRASGKYICLLDDDDLLHPNHVERLVAALEEGNARKVAFTECEIGIYETDGKRLHLLGERRVFSREDFSRDLLLNDNYIPIMSVMFASECAQEIGGFDESLDHFEDWDFWIRLSAREGFHKISGVSCEYRLLKTRTTVDALDETIDDRIAIYRKYPEHWTLEEAVRHAWKRINRLEADLKESLNRNAVHFPPLAEEAEAVPVRKRQRPLRRIARALVRPLRKH
ncbi:MAG: PIG-L family deacetylase [Flavobacteriaceae bacterium]